MGKKRPQRKPILQLKESKKPQGSKYSLDYSTISTSVASPAFSSTTASEVETAPEGVSSMDSKLANLLQVMNTVVDEPESNSMANGVPATSKVAEQPQAAAGEAQPPSVAPPTLPPSVWKEVVDPNTQHPYYWNPQTSEVSWTLPPGGVIMEEGGEGEQEEEENEVDALMENYPYLKREIPEVVKSDSPEAVAVEGGADTSTASEGKSAKGGTKRNSPDEELAVSDVQQASKKPRLGLRGSGSGDLSPAKKTSAVPPSGTMSPSAGGGVVSKQAEQKMRLQVSSMTDVFQRKLQYLHVSVENLTSLETLAIQLQTRLTDWKEGGLSTKYLYEKLRCMNKELTKCESMSVPDGWKCVWDSVYNCNTKRLLFNRPLPLCGCVSNRYQFLNTSTGEKTWEAPIEDIITSDVPEQMESREDAESEPEREEGPLAPRGEEDMEEERVLVVGPSLPPPSSVPMASSVSVVTQVSSIVGSSIPIASVASPPLLQAATVPQVAPSLPPVLPTPPLPRVLPIPEAPPLLPSSEAPRVLPSSEAPRLLPPSEAPRVLPPSEAPRVLPPSEAPPLPMVSLPPPAPTLSCSPPPAPILSYPPPPSLETTGQESVAQPPIPPVEMAAPVTKQDSEGRGPLPEARDVAGRGLDEKQEAYFSPTADFLGTRKKDEGMVVPPPMPRYNKKALDQQRRLDEKERLARITRESRPITKHDVREKLSSSKLPLWKQLEREKELKARMKEREMARPEPPQAPEPRPSVDAGAKPDEGCELISEFPPPNPNGSDGPEVEITPATMKQSQTGVQSAVKPPQVYDFSFLKKQKKKDLYSKSQGKNQSDTDEDVVNTTAAATGESSKPSTSILDFETLRGGPDKEDEKMTPRYSFKIGKPSQEPASGSQKTSSSERETVKEVVATEVTTETVTRSTISDDTVEESTGEMEQSSVNDLNDPPSEAPPTSSQPPPLEGQGGRVVPETGIIEGESGEVMESDSAVEKDGGRGEELDLEEGEMEEEEGERSEGEVEALGVIAVGGMRFVDMGGVSETKEEGHTTREASADDSADSADHKSSRDRKHSHSRSPDSYKSRSKKKRRRHDSDSDYDRYSDGGYKRSSRRSSHHHGGSSSSSKRRRDRSRDRYRDDSDYSPDDYYRTSSSSSRRRRGGGGRDRSYSPDDYRGKSSRRSTKSLRYGGSSRRSRSHSYDSDRDRDRDRRKSSSTSSKHKKKDKKKKRRRSTSRNRDGSGEDKVSKPAPNVLVGKVGKISTVRPLGQEKKPDESESAKPADTQGMLPVLDPSAYAIPVDATGAPLKNIDPQQMSATYYQQPSTGQVPYYGTYSYQYPYDSSYAQQQPEQQQQEEVSQKPEWQWGGADPVKWAAEAAAKSSQEGVACSSDSGQGGKGGSGESEVQPDGGAELASAVVEEATAVVEQEVEQSGRGTEVGVASESAVGEATAQPDTEPEPVGVATDAEVPVEMPSQEDPMTVQTNSQPMLSDDTTTEQAIPTPVPTEDEVSTEQPGPPDEVFAEQPGPPEQQPSEPPLSQSIATQSGVEPQTEDSSSLLTAEVPPLPGKGLPVKQDDVPGPPLEDPRPQAPVAVEVSKDVKMEVAVAEVAPEPEEEIAECEMEIDDSPTPVEQEKGVEGKVGVAPVDTETAVPAPEEKVSGVETNQEADSSTDVPNLYEGVGVAISVPTTTEAGKQEVPPPTSGPAPVEGAVTTPNSTAAAAYFQAATTQSTAYAYNQQQQQQQAYNYAYAQNYNQYAQAAYMQQAAAYGAYGMQPATAQYYQSMYAGSPYGAYPSTAPYYGTATGYQAPSPIQQSAVATATPSAVPVSSNSKSNFSLTGNKEKQTKTMMEQWNSFKEDKL